MSQPAVSVLIACFNHAAYVGEAMASVLGQSFDNFELLVLDDGSTDGSYEAAEQTAFGDPRVRLIQQENAGPSAAYNRLFAESKAPLVMLLDGDDVLEPEALGRAIQSLEDDNEAVASFGFCEAVDAFGLPHMQGERFVMDYNKERDSDELLHDLLLGNCLSAVGATLRRSAIPQGEPLFHPELPQQHTFELWLRLASTGKLIVAPEVRGLFRVHGQNFGLDPETREHAMVEALCCIDVHASRLIARHPSLEQAWPAIQAKLGALAFTYGNVERAAKHFAVAYKDEALSAEQSLMFLQCLLALNLTQAAGELAGELEGHKEALGSEQQVLFDATVRELERIKLAPPSDQPPS